MLEVIFCRFYYIDNNYNIWASIKFNDISSLKLNMYEIIITTWLIIVHVSTDICLKFELQILIT